MSGEGESAILAEEASDLQTPERTKGPDRTKEFITRSGEGGSEDITVRKDNHSGAGPGGVVLTETRAQRYSKMTQQGRVRDPEVTVTENTYRLRSKRPGDSRWDRHAVSYETEAKRNRDKDVGAWEIQEGLNDWRSGENDNLPKESIDRTSSRESVLPQKPNIPRREDVLVTPIGPTQQKPPNRYKGLDLRVDHFKR